MTNILITGGAGFIATHLIEELLRDPNNFVVAADNLSMCSDKNISQFYENSNFKFIKVELSIFEEAQTLFENHKFSRVYHLAANSDISRSYTNPFIDYDNTFKTTWNILELMRLKKVKELIFASSSAIFGDVGELTIDENFGPILPISHYGAGKLASEAFISSFAYNYEMEILIVRFPNVIGEYSTHGVIYDFVKNLKNNPDKLMVLGNGLQEKSYLYVKDLVGAIRYAWQAKTKGLDIFNVGGSDTINVAKIAKLVVNNINPKASIHFSGGDRGWKGDVPKFSYNISKILKTGWIPKYNSEEAVEITVKSLISQ